MELQSLKQSANLVEFLLSMRRSFGEDRLAKKVSVAFLGYTDIMLNKKEWNETGLLVEKLVNRPNRDRLKAIHGRSDVDIVPSLPSLLTSIFGPKVNLSIFDFTHYEGSEIKHDFNYEIPAEYHNKFDLIIDNGTIEHIFNLPQALINVKKMLKLQGVVFHVGPMIMPNHGFYSYNPTLFADFYEANGFSIEDLIMRGNYNFEGRQETATISGIPKYDRFSLPSVLREQPALAVLEWNLLVLAMKKQEISDTIWPIQHKYRAKEQWV